MEIPKELSYTKDNRIIDIRDKKNILGLSFEVSWGTVFNIVCDLVSSVAFNGNFQYANKMLFKISLFGPCVPKGGDVSEKWNKFPFSVVH